MIDSIDFTALMIEIIELMIDLIDFDWINHWFHWFLLN